MWSKGGASNRNPFSGLASSVSVRTSVMASFAVAENFIDRSSRGVPRKWSRQQQPVLGHRFLGSRRDATTPPGLARASGDAFGRIEREAAPGTRERCFIWKSQMASIYDKA